MDLLRIMSLRRQRSSWEDFEVLILKTILRVASVLVLLLALLGVIACGVGIFYIWRFHQTAPPEAQVMAERVESGFERATLTIQTVQRGLEQALVSVEAVNRESSKLKGSSN